MYCHVNARTPISTKLGQMKEKESSCISADTGVHDSPTVTVITTRQVKIKLFLKILLCNYSTPTNVNKKPVPSFSPPKKAR